LLGREEAREGGDEEYQKRGARSSLAYEDLNHVVEEIGQMDKQYFCRHWLDRPLVFIPAGRRRFDDELLLKGKTREGD